MHEKVEVDGKSKWKIVFADRNFGLRGINPRSFGTKLTFACFICFRNSREFYQALMRVGRADDECERLMFGEGIA